jgi:hypothetical protein
MTKRGIVRLRLGILLLLGIFILSGIVQASWNETWKYQRVLQFSDTTEPRNNELVNISIKSICQDAAWDCSEGLEDIRILEDETTYISWDLWNGTAHNSTSVPAATSSISEDDLYLRFKIQTYPTNGTYHKYHVYFGNRSAISVDDNFTALTVFEDDFEVQNNFSKWPDGYARSPTYNNTIVIKESTSLQTDIGAGNIGDHLYYVHEDSLNGVDQGRVSYWYKAPFDEVGHGFCAVMGDATWINYTCIGRNSRIDELSNDTVAITWRISL